VVPVVGSMLVWVIHRLRVNHRLLLACSNAQTYVCDDSTIALELISIYNHALELLASIISFI
jgi:hypothetical protein